MNRVPLERKVLSENDRIAAELRTRFSENGILCLNLVSSPGAGKTSLLERTLEGFPRGQRVAVLTGDIQTDNDAVRLSRFGFPVRQITKKDNRTGRALQDSPKRCPFRIREAGCRVRHLAGLHPSL